ncbi:MAG: hypothetical protein H0X49_15190 [Acidobacteria bacterium]|nr:hypothetical protein [Acidobacteriota bacterium]
MNQIKKRFSRERRHLACQDQREQSKAIDNRQCADALRRCRQDACAPD